MKLRIDRKALLDLVGLAAGVTSNRGPRPILQHLLMEATGDTLQLLATDQEISIRCILTGIQGEEPGRFAFPANTLQEILREAPGSSINLSTDGRLALLRYSGGQFRLTGENPEDFPEIKGVDESEFQEMAAEDFRELAERTQFAAAKELGRYAINGILVEIEGDQVRFVSTDGRRLALARSKIQNTSTGLRKQIIPLKGIQHFLKAIGSEDKTVGLALSDRRAFLRAGRFVLTATAIEAGFPDYQRVLQSSGVGQTVLLDRDAFFSCVRQAAIMAGDDSPQVLLTFSEGSLVISSRLEGRGDARSEMPANYAGADVSFCFNPEFLLDFAKVSLPAELPFGFRDAESSCVFRPTEEFSYVVMPVTT